LSAPIIVSALFGPEDQHFLNRQRSAYFPPERNVLAAHLTLFHHLPPSVEPELRQRLKSACVRPAPRAELSALMSLGRGVAYRVHAPELQDIRAELAEAFAGMFTPQDQAGWRPHVTIQNKVTPQAAKTLLAELGRTFTPRPLVLAGLAAWFYRGGPWELIAAWRFGSGRKMEPPTPLFPC
jgi:2'-5' RNA ligase superfamily